MSLERLFTWGMSHGCRVAVALFLITGPLLVGCADRALDPQGSFPAYLSLGAMVQDGASDQLALVDAWRVRVSRPGGGLVAEDSGQVGPNELTITVQLAVALEAACETLNLVIELSSAGEVWFRSERQEEICIGSGNDIDAQQLQWVGPSLGLTPSSLFFTLAEGQSPQARDLTISNQGGGTLLWSASDNQGWISLSQTSGSIGPGQSTQVSVIVSDEGLESGQHQGLVTVAGANAINPVATVPVTLTYTRGPEIGLSATSLSFTTPEAVASDPQTLLITNTEGGVLNWTASADQDWLSFSPITGTLGPGQSQEVSVSVDPGPLEAGNYPGIITVSDPGARNSPRRVMVGLTLLPGPRIEVNPGGVELFGVSGEERVSQLLTIQNGGDGVLNWTATLSDVTWLSLSSTSGSVGEGQSQELVVRADPASLNPGVFPASILISDPAALNSPLTVPVSFTVDEGPRLELSTHVLNYTMARGTNPIPKPLIVENAGGGTMEWMATVDVPWMELSPDNGTLARPSREKLVAVFIDAAAMSEGNYSGTITVSSPTADDSPQTVVVNLEIQENVPPVISNLGVSLVQLNDPTCPGSEVHGSRFKVAFDYADPNGDLPIISSFFVGTPIDVITLFPDFLPETFSTSAQVAGDGFSGQAAFETCILYYGSPYQSLGFTLRDAMGLVSNALATQIFRPVGGNSPPQMGGEGG